MNPIQREPSLDLAAIVETVEMMEAGIDLQEVEIEIQEVEIVNWVAETEEAVVVVVVVDCCAVEEWVVFRLSCHCAIQAHVLAGDDPGAEFGICLQAGHGCTCTDSP